MHLMAPAGKIPLGAKRLIGASDVPLFATDFDPAHSWKAPENVVVRRIGQPGLRPARENC